MTRRAATAPAVTAERLWATPHRTAVAGVLCLMMFIAFEAYAIVTALPVIAADLQADSWYSFAFAATVTTGLLGMIIGGNWADRSGIRTPLAVGGSMFLLGLALSAIAPDMSVFIAGRLLQGLGGGIDSVITYVLIAQLLPERLRPRMFGLLVTAWLLPAMIGPLLTGVVVDRLHWRALFVLILLGSAAALIALLHVARRAPTPRCDTPILGRRGLWAAVACLGVVGLHLTAQLATTWAITLTVLAVVVTAAATYQLMPVGTLRARPGPPRLIAVRGLLGATVAATDIYLTHYLQRELDYSPTGAGVVVAVGALGWFTGAWLHNRSSDSGTPDRLGLAAAFVVIGPLAVLTLVTGLTTVPLAAGGCALMGAGMGMAYPRISAAALARTEPTRHGHVSSALQSIEQLSTSTLTAVTGLLLVALTAGGYTITYALIAAVGGLGLGILVRRPDAETS
ncbi:MFS transporter [Brachybacterium sacelli]|uniref:MFS family permease n=1 Tax=Brachybacterium sacelli TaxID=173364 RepID=A0ABS4WYU1_9MICO|nr:MFS transporter [Brachybacterium sacelli]MBP2381382.1 MFS family permease [Brachybacterium sacelli]